MRRLPHILALALVCALLVPAVAQAKPRTLWPGVTYDEIVESTPKGPVVIRVLRGPRPNGTTTLQPVLSSGTLTGRETVTAITRQVAGTATAAGVNGDFSRFDNGLPSGIVVHEGQLVAAPSAARSSVGILTDGSLEIRRSELFGTWQGAGRPRVLNRFNEIPEANQTSLFTSAFGALAPAIPGSVAVVFFPFPATVPNVSLEAIALEVHSGAFGTPIPPGGAVLVARGAAASAVTAEVPLGQLVLTRLILRPEWPGLVAALGGGPLIVRDGAPIGQANEGFTRSQLAPRAPRTAIGQAADGDILLVTVDGRQPGYSVGMTNAQLARSMARLGAVTAMALDGGGSTTMAFDGALLNRPSEGPERPISNALLFLYEGIFVPPPAGVASPNGDGVDDDPGFAYKVVRPSTVTATLVAPDGTEAFTETVERAPGTYPIALPGVEAGVAATGLASGKWVLRTEAVDDLAQATSMSQTYTLNSTLGFLAAAPAKAFVPPGGTTVVISWRQELAARVVVTIEDRDGNVVRTLALRRYEPGDRSVAWDGLGKQRSILRGGMYTARVAARNRLGTTELTLKVPLRNIAKRRAG